MPVSPLGGARRHTAGTCPLTVVTQCPSVQAREPREAVLQQQVAAYVAATAVVDTEAAAASDAVGSTPVRTQRSVTEYRVLIGVIQSVTPLSGLGLAT